jgi:hypothetical protein
MVLVAVGVVGIVAFASAKMNAASMAASRRKQLEVELEGLKQLIASSVDCRVTMAKARDVASAASDEALCQMPRPSIRLYRKTASGGARLLTSPNGQIGRWGLEVGCDWGRRTLVVQAVELTRKGAEKDPAHRTYSSDSLRLALFGGKSKANLCLQSGGVSNLASFGHGYLDTRGELAIEVPSGTERIEIETTGQFQGKGDSGADVMAERIMVNLSDGRYSGSQMVKIGSNAGKSRSVYWENAGIGQAPAMKGHVNSEMGDNFRKEKMPNPLIRNLPPGPDGKRRIGFSDRIEDPGEDLQRWWAQSVSLKFYGDSWSQKTPQTTYSVPEDFLRGYGAGADFAMLKNQQKDAKNALEASQKSEIKGMKDDPNVSKQELKAAKKENKAEMKELKAQQKEEKKQAKKNK